MRVRTRRQAIRRATPARNPRAGRRARAYTLVELIAVTVILAVLAALAVPALSRASSSRANVAANILLADLLYARERALSTAASSWVDFALPDGWALLAEDPDNPGRASATSILDPDTGAPLARDLAADHFAGVSISSITLPSGSSLAFDPLGRPLDSAANPLSAPATIRLSSGHILTIAPETGLVTLTRP